MGNKKKLSLTKTDLIAFAAGFAVMSLLFQSPFSPGGLIVNLAVGVGAAAAVRWYGKRKGQKSSRPQSAAVKSGSENVANTKKASERVGIPPSPPEERPPGASNGRATARPSTRFSRRATGPSPRCAA